MKPSLGWGLIGASDIAATRMIPAMRVSGDTVVGVMSGDPDRATTYAERNQLEFCTSDIEALLDRSDVDAVYISSTNEKHFAQTMAALAAGKHVLCEKPLALTMTDATDMVEFADKVGLVLAVNHHLPGADTHRTIRRLVREGAIGEPLAIRVAHAVMLPERLRGWRLGAVAGGGVIFDITCHDASVVNAIIDQPPASIATIAVNQGRWEAGAYDAAMTTMRYGDVLVQLHDAFTVGYAKTSLEVHGTEGSLTATDVMTQDPVGDIALVDPSGRRVIDVGDRRDLYQIIVEAFRAAVHGEGRPTVTGVEGANALAIAIAAQQSADTGGALVAPAVEDLSNSL